MAQLKHKAVFIHLYEALSSEDLKYTEPSTLNSGKKCFLKLSNGSVKSYEALLTFPALEPHFRDDERGFCVPPST